MLLSISDADVAFVSVVEKLSLIIYYICFKLFLLVKYFRNRLQMDTRIQSNIS